jgi:hypothetical protein
MPIFIECAMPYRSLHVDHATPHRLGQLDETGCCIDINHDVLRIYDQHNQLLVKVQRDVSQLYHL